MLTHLLLWPGIALIVLAIMSTDHQVERITQYIRKRAR